MNYREICLRRPLKGLSKCGLCNQGGLLIQCHLTGNSIPWSWLQWPSKTGGHLIRVLALTGFTVAWHSKVLAIALEHSAHVSEIACSIGILK